MTDDIFSQIQTDILVGIIVSPAFYVIGLLTKKLVGRKLYYIWKWLINDIVTMELIAVREYPHTNLKSVMNIHIFDKIKNDYPNAKLIQHWNDGMMI